MNEFIQAIEEYFDLIENHSSYEKGDFYGKCSRLIPKIYFYSHSLPAPKEIRDLEELDFSELYNPMGDLTAFLGDDSVYNEIFDPIVGEEKVKGCIVDDLTDIYTDLKEGYIKWQRGSDEWIDEALWDWRHSLQHHMGDHMVDVMRPLHRLSVFGYAWESEQDVVSDTD